MGVTTAVTTNHATITINLRPSITTRMLMGWILQPRITIDGRPVTIDHPTTLTLQVKATVHRITATTAPRWRPPTPPTPLANRGTKHSVRSRWTTNLPHLTEKCAALVPLPSEGISYR